MLIKVDVFFIVPHVTLKLEAYIIGGRKKKKKEYFLNLVLFTFKVA